MMNEGYLDSDLHPDDGSVLIYEKLGTSNDYTTPILERLTDYLNYKNINMNISILKLIKDLEDLLENEIKKFLESLTPIFFNMRVVEDDYLKVLSRNVKLTLKNPNRVIPDMFIKHFKDK